MIDAELASKVVRLALDRGASDAECTLSEGEEFSASVRMRSLETLKDAGSRGAGLRVLLGRQVGSSYTSDLSSEGVRKLVDSALEIAAISTEDPHAGLPDPSELGSLAGDLQLYSDDVSRIDTQQRIDQALEAEDAALSADPRITNS
jgi:PmbA protein